MKDDFRVRFWGVGLRFGRVFGSHLDREDSMFKVSRRTVRAALASAWPQPRRAMPPRASKLDDFKSIIDAILRADLDAPRKQRHTVTRIYDRLLAEHGMQGVSYSVVRRYVADRKPKIRSLGFWPEVSMLWSSTTRSTPRSCS
jgi:hypothetical protein